MGRPLTICGIDMVLGDMGWCLSEIRKACEERVRLTLEAAWDAASTAKGMAAEAVSASRSRITDAGLDLADVLDDARYAVLGDRALPLASAIAGASVGIIVAAAIGHGR